MTDPVGEAVTRPRDADLAAAHRQLARLKERFISVTAHELRTPLTTIAAFAGMLLEDELPPPQRPAAIEAINRNAQRMLGLLDDLTLLSRLESGDVVLGRAEVGVPALVAAVAEALRAGLPGVPVTVEQGDGPPVRGDEALLREMLYAAAGAVAATQGSVTITARYAGAGWSLLADAPAVSPLTDEYLLAAVLPTMEEPPRRRTVGVWVLIADAVAQRHGGTMAVDERADGVSSISMRLPAET